MPDRKTPSASMEYLVLQVKIPILLQPKDSFGDSKMVLETCSQKALLLVVEVLESRPAARLLSCLFFKLLGLHVEATVSSSVYETCIEMLGQ